MWVWSKSPGTGVVDKVKWEGSVGFEQLKEHCDQENMEVVK